jgi:diacylglycerol kinase (ATP)
MLVAIGNTSSYGGGMLICPQADPYDGLLDVTIIHPVSRLKLLRLFPEMYSGKFVRDACVEQLRVREATVEGPGWWDSVTARCSAQRPCRSARCRVRCPYSCLSL